MRSSGSVVAEWVLRRGGPLELIRIKQVSRLITCVPNLTMFFRPRQSPLSGFSWFRYLPFPFALVSPSCVAPSI